MTDYCCPNCRRVRRRNSTEPELVFRCSCVGGKISCPQVRWDLADWSMTDQPLADALGIGRHVVAVKRRELSQPKGTLGRRPYIATRRKIDPTLIEINKTAAENALALGCSRQRIWQLMRRLKP
jgi:hypothetical protein